MPLNQQSLPYYPRNYTEIIMRKTSKLISAPAVCVLSNLAEESHQPLHPSYWWGSSAVLGPVLSLGGHSQWQASSQTLHDWLGPSGVCHSTSSPATSQSTYPVHTPYKGVVSGSVKSLAEIKPDNVLCPSLNPSRQLFRCRGQSGWTSMIYF